MKASVSYNDFIGSSSADISDSLENLSGDNLKSISKYFRLNEEKFELIGISILGTSAFSVSLICIDLEKSKDENKVVSMLYDLKLSGNILKILFKRLNIVLHSKFDQDFDKISNIEEIRFSDFHLNA